MTLGCIGFSYREFDLVRRQVGFIQLQSGYSLQVRHEAMHMPSPGFPLLSGVFFQQL
jgi:hypothetical protein